MRLAHSILESRIGVTGPDLFVQLISLIVGIAVVVQF
jgi:hypothetical protein